MLDEAQFESMCGELIRKNRKSSLIYIFIFISIYVWHSLELQIPVYDSVWKASLSPMGTKILEIKSAIFQFSCVNLEVCSKADYESKSYRNCVANIIGWCQSGDYWTSINYNNESDTPSITTVRPFLAQCHDAFASFVKIKYAYQYIILLGWPADHSTVSLCQLNQKIQYNLMISIEFASIRPGELLCFVSIMPSLGSFLIAEFIHDIQILFSMHISVLRSSHLSSPSSILESLRALNIFNSCPYANDYGIPISIFVSANWAILYRWEMSSINILTYTIALMAANYIPNKEKKNSQSVFKHNGNNKNMIPNSHRTRLILNYICRTSMCSHQDNSQYSLGSRAAS